MTTDTRGRVGWGFPTALIMGDMIPCLRDDLVITEVKTMRGFSQWLRRMVAIGIALGLPSLAFLETPLFAASETTSLTVASSTTSDSAKGETLPEADFTDLCTDHGIEARMPQLENLPGCEWIKDFRTSFQDRIAGVHRDSIDPAMTKAMKELVPLFQERWAQMRKSLIAARHRFLLDVMVLNCLLTGEFEGDEIASVFDRWQGAARALLAVSCAESALLTTTTRKAPDALLKELKTAVESASTPELRSKATEIISILTKPSLPIKQ